MLWIKIRRYLLWIMVNFILCLSPILFYLFTKDSIPKVFSGFLSFSYTISIVSLYLFLEHRNKNITEKVIPEGRIWLTYFLSMPILVFFWVYNNPQYKNISDYVNAYVVYFFLPILGLVFTLSLCLNIPLLRDSIKEEENKRSFQEAKRTGERTKRSKDELEQEENGL